MSSSTPSRRPLQRLGLAGIGSAVLLVGIASPAAAATGVVIPLEPSEVALSTVPVENIGGPMDPMADPNAGVLTPVPVQYSGTITVDLPAELDGSAAVDVQLLFEDGDGDGAPDATYDSTDLTVVPGAGSITVTLPADDPLAGDVADLLISPVTTTLGPAFEFFDPLYYNLGFVPTGDPSTPAAVTVQPELAAFSQVPCSITSGERCPFPTPVTVGSTVALDLTAGSVLRELGLTDLTGVQVGLAQLDADGIPTGAAVELTAQVNGSTASVVIPADTAPGSHYLVVAQQTPSGGISVFNVEIALVAPEAAVVPPAAAPTTPAAPAVVNAGLRSNTGVEAVDTGSTGSTGSVAIAAGAGMLALAGVGGVAVARTRRRPAVEGGTCA